MKNKFLFASLLLMLMAFTIPAAKAQSHKKYTAIVHTNLGHRFSGVLTDVTENTFTIRSRSRKITFAADTIERLKIRSKNALNNNMLLGSLAGLASSGAVYYNQEKKGNVTAIVLPVVIVGGIVYGAGFGAFFNSFFAIKRYHDVSNNYGQIHTAIAKYVADEE